MDAPPENISINSIMKKYIGLTFDYETILSSEETQPEEDTL
jgi:hypothetical protein